MSKNVENVLWPWLITPVMWVFNKSAGFTT